MGKQLEWKNSWNGKTAGMEKQLEWKNSWNGKTAGMR
jgi:hypothetical protein